MRIAICDDDRQEMLQINCLVNEYPGCNRVADKMEISCFTSSLELIAQLEAGGHFDIFLLDVVMPSMNGIALATEIRKRDQVAKIIFLTSSSEFAVDSYSVDASHYLLKPIKKDRLFPVLEQACRDMSSGLKQYVVVKTQDSLVKLFLHELIYVEVLGRTLHFHQQGGDTVESTNRISQVEPLLLMDNRFIKPHRSYIVNFDHIKSLAQDGLRTTNGVFIPISRNVFQAVKQAYIDYSLRTEN